MAVEASAAGRAGPACGEHACLTFGEADEMLDMTAAYIRDGLSAGLKVVWVSETPSKLAARQLEVRGIGAGRALAAGQLAAGRQAGQVLSGQQFRARTALRWLTGQRAAAQRNGFAGLRVALDMSWALRPVTGTEELAAFEAGVSRAVAGAPAGVLCQYDRRRFDPVTLASAARLHVRHLTAVTYHAGGTGRICRQYAPPGLVLAGEIDYQAERPLARALAEAVRLDGEVMINMSGLRFLDARCARLIADAARTIAASASRQVTLRCLPEVATRSFRPALAHAGGVRLETCRDQ
jgi:ABC-type transporter Mla MlaB component